MSKGDWRRPAQVTGEEFRRRWEETFGKDVPEAEQDRDRDVLEAFAQEPLLRG
jgi:hypothetical protein